MRATGHRLLLIEDNPRIAEEVRRALGAEGLDTDWLSDGEEALVAPFDRYSLVILDIMLPNTSGFEILAHLRSQNSHVPVLVLSARNDTRDKVHALELGADDYVTKPFWPQELVARVKARLRRPGLQTSDVTTVDSLTIDMSSRAVRVGGRPLNLTRIEFDLVAALARRRGTTATRRWLSEQIIGLDPQATERTLDAHMSRVRKKLAPVGVKIATVWGVGYRLGDEA